MAAGVVALLPIPITVAPLVSTRKSVLKAVPLYEEAQESMVPPERMMSVSHLMLCGLLSSAPYSKIPPVVTDVKVPPLMVMAPVELRPLPPAPLLLRLPVPLVMVNVPSHLAAELIEMSLEEEGMTQKQLAQQIGISPSRINDYVTGRAEPTLKIARMLCRILKITPAEMLSC